MTELRFTGGARIGMANATWPFASLNVSKDKLSLNALIAGNLVFKPEDIISIEPYLGFMSSGLKINHRVSKYQDKVVFWTFRNPDIIIQQIRQTGFFEKSSSEMAPKDSKMIEERQNQGGFPLKKYFALVCVVIWNILILMDLLKFFSSDLNGTPLGIGSTIALGLVFLSALLILVSKRFRKLALKEGRELKDISKHLYFVLFISGFMLFPILMAILS